MAKITKAERLHAERERIFERAERKFEKAVAAMAETYLVSGYDRLLQAAADLQKRLPATYRPAPLHDTGYKVPRLQIDDVKPCTVESMALFSYGPTSPWQEEILAPYRTGSASSSPVVEA